MSFKSVLDKIGADAKAVFVFLGSPKGQAVVSTVEGAVVAFEPGASGLVALVNNWLAEIIKTESIAAAAGQQTGSGVQKAAAVVSAVAPQALQFAQANGLPSPTAAQLQAANAALVAFANAFAQEGKAL